MQLASKFKSKLPSLKNSLLAILAAILLALAFPDFEIWFFAWFALVPLFYAVEREKESIVKSFALGWIFGTFFFFASCWWLSYPMIHYADMPVPVAYGLVILATLTVGLLPAIFAALLSVLLKRFGTVAIFAAPFLWTAIEFLRFYVTGNNWNAIAYSQAFVNSEIVKQASVGGIYLVGFSLIWTNVIIFSAFKAKSVISYFLKKEPNFFRRNITKKEQGYLALGLLLYFIWNIFGGFFQTNSFHSSKPVDSISSESVFIIAVQPNVPMSGLRYEDWERLREKHVQLVENAIANPNFSEYANEQVKTYSMPENKTEEQTRQFYIDLASENFRRAKKVVIFPESPMNFAYTRDREFQQFLKEFTAKNNVSVLFNAGEPSANDGIYNSALLVNERGERVAQYDKIHLLPFGEFVPFPAPFDKLMPPVVGTFEFGKSYDLLPLGNDIQAGVMICFESHFPTLSREFALRGADVIVEMTNDGYLGDTPVLRQHLANAVFRAVETNRPVVRVTNVGITAFINERGEVLDATKSYVEDTRVWTVSKSDGKQTFYVKYGDWFAWLCSLVSLVLLGLSFRKTNLTQRREEGGAQS